MSPSLKKKVWALIREANGRKVTDIVYNLLAKVSPYATIFFSRGKSLMDGIHLKFIRLPWDLWDFFMTPESTGLTLSLPEKAIYLKKVIKPNI